MARITTGVSTTGTGGGSDTDTNEDAGRETGGGEDFDPRNYTLPPSLRRDESPADDPPDETMDEPDRDVDQHRPGGSPEMTSGGGTTTDGQQDQQATERTEAQSSEERRARNELVERSEFIDPEDVVFREEDGRTVVTVNQETARTLGGVGFGQGDEFIIEGGRVGETGGGEDLPADPNRVSPGETVIRTPEGELRVVEPPEEDTARPVDEPSGAETTAGRPEPGGEPVDRPTGAETTAGRPEPGGEPAEEPPVEDPAADEERDALSPVVETVEDVTGTDIPGEGTLSGDIEKAGEQIIEGAEARTAARGELEQGVETESGPVGEQARALEQEIVAASPGLFAEDVAIRRTPEGTLTPEFKTVEQFGDAGVTVPGTDARAEDLARELGSGVSTTLENLTQPIEEAGANQIVLQSAIAESMRTAPTGLSSAEFTEEQARAAGVDPTTVLKGADPEQADRVREVEAELVRGGGEILNIPATAVGLKEGFEFIGAFARTAAEDVADRIEQEPSRQAFGPGPGTRIEGDFIEFEQTQAFGARAGRAGIEAIEAVEKQFREKPIETGAFLGGALLVSGGVIRGASKVSPRAGKIAAFGIQPGEELIGTVGGRATRATLGARAQRIAFPQNEPLIISEEAGIAVAKGIGASAKRTAGTIRRMAAGRMTDIDAPPITRSRIGAMRELAPTGTRQTEGALPDERPAGLTIEAVEQRNRQALEQGKVGAEPADVAEPVEADTQGVTPEMERVAFETQRQQAMTRLEQDISPDAAGGPFAAGFNRAARARIEFEQESQETVPPDPGDVRDPDFRDFSRQEVLGGGQSEVAREELVRAQKAQRRSLEGDFEGEVDPVREGERRREAALEREIEQEGTRELTREGIRTKVQPAFDLRQSPIQDPALDQRQPPAQDQPPIQGVDLEQRSELDTPSLETEIETEPEGETEPPRIEFEPFRETEIETEPEVELEAETEAEVDPFRPLDLRSLDDDRRRRGGFTEVRFSFDVAVDGGGIEADLSGLDAGGIEADLSFDPLD